MRFSWTPTDSVALSPQREAHGHMVTRSGYIFSNVWPCWLHGMLCLSLAVLWCFIVDHGTKFVLLTREFSAVIVDHLFYVSEWHHQTQFIKMSECCGIFLRYTWCGWVCLCNTVCNEQSLYLSEYTSWGLVCDQMSCQLQTQWPQPLF